MILSYAQDARQKYHDFYPKDIHDIYTRVVINVQIVRMPNKKGVYDIYRTRSSSGVYARITGPLCKDLCQQVLQRPTSRGSNGLVLPCHEVIATNDVCTNVPFVIGPLRALAKRQTTCTFQVDFKRNLLHF